MVNKRIQDYLSLPLTWVLHLISYLPMPVLLGISSVLYFFIYRVFRYRVEVVRENLQNSFPEKTKQELRKIEKDFYLNFSDVMVEVIKLKTISFTELKRRCQYSEDSVALLNRFFHQGRSIMIVLGHMGNWEWAGSSYPLYNLHQIITAYRPLRNKVVDQDTLTMRQRTGNILASMKNLTREMLRNRNNIVATALIADQTPAPENAFWVDFLHQPTPFFKGTEVLSQKFNLPLIWGRARRLKRGYYFIEFEVITENPQEYKTPGSLTHLHASFLEKDIQENPSLWLWSHKRWKHPLPEGEAVVGPAK